MLAYCETCSSVITTNVLQEELLISFYLLKGALCSLEEEIITRNCYTHDDN